VPSKTTTDNAPPTLLEPLDLASDLGKENLVLIDSRDEAAYLQNHLPGAVSIQDIFYYLCLPENGGLVGLQDHFVTLFSKAGIRPTDRVVVYEEAHDNGYGKSCRGWLILKYLGHSNVQVLHGGMRAWKALNLPLTAEVPHRDPVQFQAQITPGHIIGLAEMHLSLTDPQAVIVDCRDYAEWLGANSSPYGYDYCPRKGRIPGSIWLEWYRLMEHRDGAAWFRSKREIRKLCKQHGITPDKKIVVYCFKGARAAAVVMALRHSGFESVFNYLPSWNEWSRDMSLPVDEEYPLEQIKDA
jgi:thiosulfate/3-mercaptopyruvate sulfurtransferase